MTGSVLKTDIYTDFQGLSVLRARAKNNNEQTLRDVAGQFEALFIQMMLKTMRDASLGEGLLDSEHTKTYQAMFDKQIAIDMSKSPGIGLAEMMVRQLGNTGSRETSVEAGEAVVSSADNVPPATHGMRPLRSLHQASLNRRQWEPDSPDQFIRDVWPHAERAAAGLGVRPEALVAQAALETGWGKHMIRASDGSNSFNLFGIKADSSWRGDRVSSDTLEFRDGVMRKERAQFRVYGSLGDSFSDYAEFLKANPRYEDALNKAKDAPAFTYALEEAGYATDPDYSSKINTIMNSDRLRDVVSEIKASRPGPLS